MLPIAAAILLAAHAAPPAPRAAADGKAVPQAAQPALDLRFDATALADLGRGEALPACFAPIAGDGLVLVRTGFVGSALHMSFECAGPRRPGGAAGEASLLLSEGRLTGFVVAPDGTRFDLRALDRGAARATPADAALELPCATDHTHRPPAREGAVAGAAACDDGSVVDVFVVYTAAAVAQAGGATAIADSIAWAVGDSNAIYAASGVPMTLRLVGTRLADGYVEDSASMANDLYALRDPADAKLDAEHAAGAAAGADLIALVRANGGGACGVAFIVGGSPADVDYGVSVTALGCFSNRTFTHELGHNMGCCHAPGDGGGCTSGGVLPYGTGHRFVATDGAEYRTVMAYQPGTRIGRLSSPIVSYQGTPTGIAGERDNARSIRELKANIANFRCSVCEGDLDGNRTVDAADLGTLLAAWGTPAADLNGDATTDAADLSVMLGNWGACGD